jgi:CheY-like chemotaxis protein
MLDAVSNLLSDDFTVVAAVTDGRQAIEAVRRLDPDVAVLDITMPALDRRSSFSRCMMRTSTSRPLFDRGGTATC